MPYIIKKIDGGYKVCKVDEPNKCFSKKPIPKSRAIKQLRAIGMNEHKGGAINTDDFVEGYGKPSTGKPINNLLYNRIKEEVYKKNPKHSLYRSALIQKLYQSEGGQYEEGGLPKMNIKKWFKQDWISLNDYLRGDIVPCGDNNAKEYNEYPLCRPKAIADKLSKKEIKTMIEEKTKIGEKPLKTADVIGREDLNIKPTNTGMGRFHIDKFIKQLMDIKLNPDIYLDVAKRVAKREGYDPDKLSLAVNNDNKLKYESPEGIKYFGKAGYGDYIIWSYLERNNEVPKGYADMKRNVFRKSHGAMSKKYDLGKYSPNELAIKVIW
jgi:hypothetical protein